MSQDTINKVLYSEGLEPLTLLIVLAAAFVIGAFHALGPGHGKSLMAAYLIGTKGRLKDVLILTIGFTLSHVLSVFAIGLIALVLTDFFWSETLNKYISLVSGLLILLIGLWLLVTRMANWKKGTAHSHVHSSDHPHTHTSVHTHPHSNSHPFPNADGKLGFKKTVLLGVSSGIVPCPKALVILFLAISLHKIALGLAIIVVFSLGLAAVLTAIGVIMIKASHLLQHQLLDNRIHIIPIIGSVIIIGLGVWMTISAWLNL
ncbi:MAG TPA: sulfite exporter TauE/SafE family protein [bacterium]|nr:sulfite exporter TauE/SafE family protein [bacterium]HPG46804.1 sulfite exporter TauE/SafE family protein [bacterium]HPM98866.1 sulfite exporter TauE/SafE family protein [bacterium]